jgi:hypothetical protein
MRYQSELSRAAVGDIVVRSEISRCVTVRSSSSRGPRDGMVWIAKGAALPVSLQRLDGSGWRSGIQAEPGRPVERVHRILRLCENARGRVLNIHSRRAARQVLDTLPHNAADHVLTEQMVLSLNSTVGPLCPRRRRGNRIAGRGPGLSPRRKPSRWPATFGSWRASDADNPPAHRETADEGDE